MSKSHDITPSVDSRSTGEAARRRFLRTSGKVAVAAPAALLLLSASKSADAITAADYPPRNGDNTPPT